MMTLMVFLARRKLFMRLGYLSPDARNVTVMAMRLGYLSPDARNVTVMASFKPVGSAFLTMVFRFSILGAILCANSSNMAGSILR